MAKESIWGNLTDEQTVREVAYGLELLQEERVYEVILAWARDHDLLLDLQVECEDALKAQQKGGV
jgi:hypothetical protein